MDPEFSIHDLLGALLGDPMAAAPSDKSGKQAAAVQTQAQCPECGLTFDDFRHTGMLGCDHCYQAFAPQLGAILRHIHGSNRHGGKLPRRAGQSMIHQRQIKDLRRQLDEAVTREDFEKAAQLRDRVRDLQKQKSSGEGGAGHGA